MSGRGKGGKASRNESKNDDKLGCARLDNDGDGSKLDGDKTSQERRLEGGSVFPAGLSVEGEARPSDRVEKGDGEVDKGASSGVAGPVSIALDADMLEIFHRTVVLTLEGRFNVGRELFLQWFDSNEVTDCIEAFGPIGPKIEWQVTFKTRQLATAFTLEFDIFKLHTGHSVISSMLGDKLSIVYLHGVPYWLGHSVLRDCLARLVGGPVLVDYVKDSRRGTGVFTLERRVTSRCDLSVLPKLLNILVPEISLELRALVKVPGSIPVCFRCGAAGHVQRLCLNLPGDKQAVGALAAGAGQSQGVVRPAAGVSAGASGLQGASQLVAGRDTGLVQTQQVDNLDSGASSSGSEEDLSEIDADSQAASELGTDSQVDGQSDIKRRRLSVIGSQVDGQCDGGQLSMEESSFNINGPFDSQVASQCDGSIDGGEVGMEESSFNTDGPSGEVPSLAPDNNSFHGYNSVDDFLNALHSHGVSKPEVVELGFIAEPDVVVESEIIEPEVIVEKPIIPPRKKPTWSALAVGLGEGGVRSKPWSGPPAQKYCPKSHLDNCRFGTSECPYLYRWASTGGKCEQEWVAHGQRWHEAAVKLFFKRVPQQINVSKAGQNHCFDNPVYLRQHGGSSG